MALLDTSICCTQLLSLLEEARPRGREKRRVSKASGRVSVGKLEKTRSLSKGSGRVHAYKSCPTHSLRSRQSSHAGLLHTHEEGPTLALP